MKFIHLLRRPSDGKLVGYNTDCEAAITSIEDSLIKEKRCTNGKTSLNSPLSGKLFVLVGAGGAGRALAFGAKSKGARIVVFDIDFDRVKSLAFAVTGEVRRFEDLATFQPEKGVILANATPLGMHPNTDRIPVSEASLRDYQIVFDSVYTPKKTRLLKEAEAAGAIIIGGVEMFLRQAIGQFNLFTGGQVLQHLKSSCARLSGTSSDVLDQWKYTICCVQYNTESLTNYCLVFDAIYTPNETKFSKEAKETGVVIYEIC